MLIPNLSVLLAERRLTISRVSEDTRISRTTLTALAGHNAKGIQFETLNTLCQYLKITPGELFLYRPFDVSLAFEGAPLPTRVTLAFTRSGGAPENLALDCEARFLRSSDNGPIEALRVRLSLPADPDPDRRARDGELLALLRALPQPVLAELERDVLARLDRFVTPDQAPRDYSPDLLWPWD